MNKSKHTPGPWKILWGESNKRTKCGKWMLHCDSRHIGTICGHHLGKDAGRANAELCAAAPDLLAACEAAMRDRFGGDDPCCDADPVNNQLRAAIAKAHGGVS